MMCPQEVSNLVDRFGKQVFRLSPGIYRHFSLRRQRRDIHGDRVWVRADQIVYLYIPKWIMDEGRRVNDEQRAAEDVAADAGKQKRARAKRPKAAS